MARTEPFVLVSAPLEGASCDQHIPLDDQARHHLGKVLRLRAGQALMVADGSGWSAAATLGSDEVTLLEDARPENRAATEVHVWQALGKGRKHDDVVRILTELGVSSITAIVTEHTVARPPAPRHAALQSRWEAVARAACEQSRRARLPVVGGPLALDALLSTAPAGLFVTDTVGGQPLLGALRDGSHASVVLAVGPEGGWSAAERQRFDEVGAIAVTLGPHVLRTEHAASVAASIALAALAWSED